MSENSIPKYFAFKVTFDWPEEFLGTQSPFQ